MKKHFKKSRREKRAGSKRLLKRVLSVVLCVLLVCTGYIGARVYMLRHARPVSGTTSKELAEAQEFVEIPSVSFSALHVPALALDASVMLSSAVSEASRGGYSAICFDLKREDGTIGYKSALTSVETFSAVSAPASRLADSVISLKQSKIIPVARISCYMDNIVPSKSGELAVMKGKKVFRDDSGNTYLNPDSPSVYKYIKELVQECRAAGISVFVLCHTSLPGNAPKAYSKGSFEALSKRLSADIEGGASFVEEVDVKINGWDDENGEYNDEGIKNDIAQLPEIEGYQVYFITTEADEEKVNGYLQEAGVSSYVITD